MACGLSLGEYTALTYAGAMSFEDGLRLVKLRGESMQAAADAKPSGMVSVIGLDADKARAVFAWVGAAGWAGGRVGGRVGVRVGGWVGGWVAQLSGGDWQAVQGKSAGEEPVWSEAR